MIIGTLYLRTQSKQEDIPQNQWHVIKTIMGTKQMEARIRGINSIWRVRKRLYLGDI